MQSQKGSFDLRGAPLWSTTTLSLYAMTYEAASERNAEPLVIALQKPPKITDETRQEILYNGIRARILRSVLRYASLSSTKHKDPYFPHTAKKKTAIHRDQRNAPSSMIVAARTA